MDDNPQNVDVPPRAAGASHSATGSRSGTPADLATKLTALEPLILANLELAALKVFGLSPPPAVDRTSQQIYMPVVYKTAVTEYRQAHWRSETDQEKFDRIAVEERLRQAVDEKNVDHVLEWMSYTRDHILSVIDVESG